MSDAPSLATSPVERGVELELCPLAPQGAAMCRCRVYCCRETSCSSPYSRAKNPHFLRNTGGACGGGVCWGFCVA